MEYMRHRVGLRGILRLGDDSDLNIKFRMLHHELYDSADDGEQNRRAMPRGIMMIWDIINQRIL